MTCDRSSVSGWTDLSVTLVPTMKQYLEEQWNVFAFTYVYYVMICISVMAMFSSNPIKFLPREIAFKFFKLLYFLCNCLRTEMRGRQSRLQSSDFNKIE